MGGPWAFVLWEDYGLAVDDRKHPGGERSMVMRWCTSSVAYFPTTTHVLPLGFLPT